MDFLKKIEANMGDVVSQLDAYKADFVNAEASSPAAAISFVSDPSREIQERRLQEMYDSIKILRKMVDSAMERLKNAERRVDDLEQYGRSNCLIIHGCTDVPRTREYCVVEKYVCGVINEKVKPTKPLQVSDLDIAHPLPSRRGSPVIVKFLRRTQRNDVFARKRNLKNSGMVITESLTRRRLHLLQDARKAFEGFQVWTMKGEIFVFFNNKKQVINDFSDIKRIRDSC